MEPPQESVDPAPRKRRFQSPHVWVPTTYFGEGFPYSIVNNLAEILFLELGASLQAIGLTSLFHLPWNLKFLVGPFVDHYETKRRWLLGVEVALTACLLVLSLVVSGSQWLSVLAACFVVLAILSATHDIAIDGYYLEGLDEKGQSRFVGYRAMAYKVASLLVRGPLLILVGWIGWSGGILTAAGLMLALTVIHAFVLPRVERRKQSVRGLVRGLFRPRVLFAGAVVAGVIAAQRCVGVFDPVVALGRRAIDNYAILGSVSLPGWIALSLLATLLLLLVFLGPIKRRISRSESYYGAAFVDFLSRDRVGWMLAFVVLFRSGESFLQKMKWPFLRDGLGMSLDQYGFINGTLGVMASFAGTLLGGFLISRHGLKRWFWPLVLAQNTTNLLYALLAWLGATGTVGIWFVTLMIMGEHVGEGLGTAVFMVYLMRCCDPSHKAAHMAILTALMSVSFTIAGVASGFLASWMGFFAYFVFTFVVSVPAMAIVPWIPNRR